MKGFIYTILVMIIAISFMYVLAVQNSMQDMPQQDYDALLVSNYYKAYASLNSTADHNYDQVIENYKIMKNKK